MSLSGVCTSTQIPPVFMKPFLNSLDPDFYLDLHQIVGFSFIKIHELLSEKSNGEKCNPIWNLHQNLTGSLLTHSSIYHQFLW